MGPQTPRGMHGGALRRSVLQQIHASWLAQHPNMTRGPGNVHLMVITVNRFPPRRLVKGVVMQRPRRLVNYRVQQTIAPGAVRATPHCAVV